MKYTLFCLLPLLSVCHQANSQAEKQLEKFSTTDFYTSVYPSGSGTINIQTDHSVYQEGNSSLKADYTLNAASGNVAEIFRSYSVNTLDLSFRPEGLSIWVKGEASNNDILKFMLYEDNNRNGNPFESGDEIYVFTSSNTLSNTSWHRLDMPYTAFTRFGGGAGNIDLHRIYAWRIAIENGSGSSHSGSAHFDDLRQITSYTPSSSGTKRLSGSFIQLWNDVGCECGQWTDGQWKEEMEKMKQACMNKLIIQYSFWENNAWYPTSLPYATSSSPTLSRIFSAAAMTDMEIYVGLYFSESWNNTDKGQASLYSDLLLKQKSVIDELHSLYGSDVRFKGWYIPQEINDQEWQDPVKRTLLANWLKEVSSYAKSKDASKSVMIAPYFGPSQPADVLEAWWDEVLSVAQDIDIVAPQDGVGTTTKDVDVDIPHYFKAIRNACTANGVRFDAVIESFLQISGWPVNEDDFEAEPAEIGRLLLQVGEAQPYAEQLYQFEWGYMQPGRNSKSQLLYEQYQQALCTPEVIQGSVTRSFQETTIYPNPFTDQLIFRSSKTGNRMVKLYNAQGHLILAIDHVVYNEPYIFEKEFPKGIYWMEIIYDGKTEGFKVLKE